MTITIIGAGNVGYHLANELQQKDHQILQIFSRNARRFAVFPPSLSQKGITNWEKINKNADVYLIAVNDQAIEVVSQKLKEIGVTGIVAHTSGATSLKILKHHKKRGIFYPLQSFSLFKEVNWLSVPFCIDGNTETVKNELYQLAQDFTPITYFMDDEQRQILHVAAVFVNNFTNHFLVLGEEICLDFGVPFDILKPLIRETFEKVQLISPKNAQTGPAIRGDESTLKKHINLLQNHPAKQALYQLISESIATKHQ